MFNPLITRQLLIAIRGKRSQQAVNKKFQVNFNQTYRWETGHTKISWLSFVKLCAVCKVDLSIGLKGVFNIDAPPEQFGLIVRTLCGTRSVTEITQLTQTTPYKARNWLKHRASPTLEHILKLMDGASHLLPEFVDALVGVDNVPCLKSAFATNRLQKTLHRDLPFAGAVLHAIETTAYKRLKVHVEGWIASTVGIDREQEELAISTLLAARFVKLRRGKLVTNPVQIDLRGDFQCFKSTRRYWLERSLRRLEALKSPSREDFFGYLMFNVSAEARQKVVDRYVQFLTDVRSIAESDKGESADVQLLAVQLMDLRETLANERKNLPFSV